LKRTTRRRESATPPPHRMQTIRVAAVTRVAQPTRRRRLRTAGARRPEPRRRRSGRRSPTTSADACAMISAAVLPIHRRTPMSQTAGLFTDGEAYERLMGRWSRLTGDIFLDWLDSPANLRWLDVGCGNGAFTAALIERCAPAEVVGLDPSESQIAYARTRPGAKS